MFVTGASAGFGASIARRFAADGDRVVVSARRADRIDELAKEFGDAVLPVTFDVRDRDAVAAAVAGLPAEFAEIDVLVNNAGLALAARARMIQSQAGFSAPVTPTPRRHRNRRGSRTRRPAQTTWRPRSRSGRS